MNNHALICITYLTYFCLKWCQQMYLQTCLKIGHLKTIKCILMCYILNPLFMGDYNSPGNVVIWFPRSQMWLHQKAIIAVKYTS